MTRIKAALRTLGITLAGVFLFFILTAPSNLDFLMICPDGHYAENLFCYPEHLAVDTAAYDWIGRIRMISEPIVFENPPDFDYPASYGG